MKYSRVYMEAMGYEMAPVVVASDELEERLAPMYEELHIAPGQLEGLTGIRERRWWRTRDSCPAPATEPDTVLRRRLTRFLSRPCPDS